jgi:hypothetical protein
MQQRMAQFHLAGNLVIWLSLTTTAEIPNQAFCGYLQPTKFTRISSPTDSIFSG